MGEIWCKDEDGVKEFVKDDEGRILGEEDCEEMVMVCLRDWEMRIWGEEWEKMDCGVWMGEI